MRLPMQRAPARGDGVTSLEYAILAALVALVVIVGMGALGVEVGKLFDDIASAFK